MAAWRQENRGVGAFFALAVAVHAILVMVPPAHELTQGVVGDRILQVRLLSPPMVVQDEPIPVQIPDWRKPVVPELEYLPPEPEAPASVAKTIVRPAPAFNNARVLSSQFDYERSVRQPLFGAVEQKTEAPDFFFRQRAALDSVLNQPSLQLPFEDNRIYLVEHYEDGMMGGIEKFWDQVSLPFGFTTRNNTRVQCVWVLVVAGCGWGHKTLFHQPVRYR